MFYKCLQGKLKSAYESCTNDTECCCGQYCSFNSNNNTSVCQCSSDRWWNDAINYCRILSNIIILFIKTQFELNSNFFTQEKKSAYGGSCLTVNECEYGKNMVCLSNMCTCSDPNSNYWNGTYCGRLWI